MLCWLKECVAAAGDGKQLAEVLARARGTLRNAASKGLRPLRVAAPSERCLSSFPVVQYRTAAQPINVLTRVAASANELSRVKEGLTLNWHAHLGTLTQ